MADAEIDDVLAELAARQAEDEAECEARSEELAKSSRPLQDVIAELTELESRIEKGEDLLKLLKSRRDLLKKREIPDTLQSLGLVTPAGKASVSLDDGRRLQLRTELYVSVKKEDQTKLHAWLAETGCDSLIVPTVHSATLRSHVREIEAAGELLPGFLTVYRETTASLIGGRKTSKEHDAHE